MVCMAHAQLGLLKGTASPLQGLRAVYFSLTVMQEVGAAH